MLWRIENASINIQSKCHVPTVIRFRVAPKTKNQKIELLSILSILYITIIFFRKEIL